MAEEQATQVSEQTQTATDRKFTKREASKNISIPDLKKGPVPPRVSVAGTVVSKDEKLYSFLIDDGDGAILAITNNVENFNNLKEGQFVRVLGKTWGEGEELEIQADIIQDFSQVDRNVYKRAVFF